MSAFNIWKENPPPRNTVVMGRYELTGPQSGWQCVKTCNHGCCVRPEPNGGFGTMKLPKFWREPTAEELSHKAVGRTKAQ